MASLTLSQAAKASGKSKSTLSRAIKMGRLSATRLDDGNFSIDPAELFRAYPATPRNPYDEHPIEQSATPVPAELQSRISMLELLLEKERETVAREREISAREREISADLKEDRDRWRQQAASLLADLRPQLAEPAPQARRRAWWRFNRK
jgi:hypothetical protein|tara:strand:+ start:831 stop:1280 length:450 start_codon:yes stop_codon:yes gene_type:complete